MRAITDDQIASLAREEGPCVSIYMPLHRGGYDCEASRITLVHAMETAQRDLEWLGYSMEAIEPILTQLKRLPLTDLWHSRNWSLAALVSRKTCFLHPIFNRVTHLEAIGDHRFHLRPLIPDSVSTDKFYVLALDENHAQLYAGNSLEIQPVSVPGMPKDKTSSLQQDAVERISCATSAGSAGLGMHAGHYHGQGGRPESDKAEMLEYIEHVAHAVDSFLHDQTCPLILVSSDWTDAMWRRHSHYPNTLNDRLTLSPDKISLKSFLDAASLSVFIALQSHKFNQFLQAERNRPWNLQAVGIDNVMPAAAQGRIEQLMISAFQPIFGSFDPATGKVEVYKDPQLGEDLLDLAITETIRHGGTVLPYADATLSEAECGHRVDVCAVKALLRY